MPAPYPYISGPCYRCNAETVFVATLPAPIVGPAILLTWGYLCHDCQRHPIGRRARRSSS